MREVNVSILSHLGPDKALQILRRSSEKGFSKIRSEAEGIGLEENQRYGEASSG